LLTTLRYGVLRVRIKDREEVFTVAGGVVEVQPSLITVMADAAENVNEIDISRAEAARRRAEEFLKQSPPTDTDAYSKIEAALRRSNLRLEAAKRYRASRVRYPGATEDQKK
jgi:F-type H+-transporting ATPase subunit epsilon